MLESIVKYLFANVGSLLSIRKIADSMTNGEVDFVAKNEQGLTYYQVSESTLQPDVIERELKPLLRIKDNYPKYLLTLDEIESTADYDGIRKLNVLKLLLDN